MSTPVSSCLDQSPPPIWLGGWRGQFAAIATGILAGFSATVLAFRGIQTPAPPHPAPIRHQLITTPNPRWLPDHLLPAVRAAKSEIFVAARMLTSKALLDALRDRAQSGVDVRILLCSETNPDARAPIPEWILSHNAGHVYLDSTNRYDQFIVMDGARAFLGTLPFTAEAPARSTSAGLMLEDAPLARDLREYFLSHIGPLKPLKR